jgi:quinohemoprotein ethanol dehydrogenase
MKWLLLGVPGIVFFTWATFAVQQQVRKIDDKTLKNTAKSSEWLTNGMNWAEQRYSTMNQITPQNVSKLALAWSYELGQGGGSQQATPLFSNGILYTVTNWSIVAAVDAKTGKEIWRYDPEADRTMTQPGKSRLCCGVNSRGIALYEGKVLVPVIDGRMQALDAATGKLLWSSWAIPQPKEGEVSPYSITMAARVAKGKGREGQSVYRQCRRRVPAVSWIRYRFRRQHRQGTLEVLHNTGRSVERIRE